MKTGFRTAGFSKWTLGAALYEINDCGYDSVELCLEHPGCRPELMDDGRIQHIKKLLDETGLELSSVSYHGDGTPIEQRQENTFLALDVARKLEANVLVINTEAKEPGNDRQYAGILERLRHLCAMAEEYDIDLALEPEPGLVIESTKDLERTINVINSPRLKINLDIGHAFLTDNDVIKTIRRNCTKIVHTHIEDIAGGIHKHLLPGEGEMNLTEIIRTLDEIGYGGYLTIDLFDLGDQPGEIARDALAALKTVMP